MKKTNTLFKALLITVSLFFTSLTIYSQCTPNFVDSACFSNGTKKFISTSTGTNASTGYFWTFGDNTTSTAQNPIHTYTANGTYTVCLFIFSAPTCSASICKTITINCVSSSSCSPNFVDSACFSNGIKKFISTSTGTNSSTTYFWSFGDNTTSTAQNPIHTYTANGTYTVCLFMFSPPTCSASICKTITVNCVTSGSCNPNFVDSACFSNGTKKFISTSTGTNINTTYSWNFGDNTTSNLKNPIHTYTANGTYTVCLFIFSPPTCSASICKTISINCVNASTCQANYTYSSCVNGNLQFWSTSIGTSTNTNYNWSFGDNTNSNLKNPSHTYSANGLYVVCLTISDSTANCFSTKCHTVTIACISTGSCLANFADSVCYNNGTKNFYSTSMGTTNQTSYTWNFGDNTNGLGQNTQHTYTNNGTYTVCLTIQDSTTNCYSTKCKTVSITCVPPTGIKLNSNLLADTKVYPNPTSGNMNIDITNITMNAKAITIYIYNILGEVLFNTNELINGNSIHKELNLNSLDNGTYIIKISDNLNYYQTRKIIVRK